MCRLLSFCTRVMFFFLGQSHFGSEGTSLGTNLLLGHGLGQYQLHAGVAIACIVCGLTAYEYVALIGECIVLSIEAGEAQYTIVVLAKVAVGLGCLEVELAVRYQEIAHGSIAYLAVLGVYDALEALSGHVDSVIVLSVELEV